MRPAYAAGIRAAIATIGPMVVGDAVGHPTAGMWMGLAGFNVSLGDKGGSRRTRGAMSGSLIFGALGAAAGAVAGRHGWSAACHRRGPAARSADRRCTTPRDGWPTSRSSIGVDRD